MSADHILKRLRQLPRATVAELRATVIAADPAERELVVAFEPKTATDEEGLKRLERLAWLAGHSMKNAVLGVHVVQSGVFPGPSWTAECPDGSTRLIRKGAWLVGFRLPPAMWGLYEANRLAFGKLLKNSLTIPDQERKPHVMGKKKDTRNALLAARLEAAERAVKALLADERPAYAPRGGAAVAVAGRGVGETAVDAFTLLKAKIADADERRRRGELGAGAEADAARMELAKARLIANDRAREANPALVRAAGGWTGNGLTAVPLFTNRRALPDDTGIQGVADGRRRATTRTVYQ